MTQSRAVRIPLTLDSPKSVRFVVEHPAATHSLLPRGVGR